jgi:hypothetical protein
MLAEYSRPCGCAPTTSQFRSLFTCHLPRTPSILFAYGGFRQGMVINKIKFGDVKMAIIRHPVDRNRRRLVATTEIRREKLKEDALEHKKGES